VSGGYQIGTATALRALHRVPWGPPHERELHAHDYRVEVLVERAELDARGTVCDLDLVEEALREATAELDGRDLEAIRPPQVDAVTVELLARWFHGRLAAAIAAAGGETLTIRVWESASAFGGYRAPLTSSSE
jgi:6-pyruvoyl-tetrahydropterin synthase